MLEHGGHLAAAAHRYGIPRGDWLDLSTGINPHGYPVPALPSEAWLRLPEDDDGLEDAAAAYYGSAQLLPVAGSQPAIQALPALIPGKRVTLLEPSYAEHRHAWRERSLRSCASVEEIEDALDSTDVLLLVNPNNPTGARFAPARLLAWHARLAARGGWLVIDEAFMDATPRESIASEAGRAGLVVLRSLGKFFGLAGARVGFVLAPAALRHALAEQLGPWAVSGPARHVARAALRDAAWQAGMRERLAAEGARLAALLRTAGLGESAGPALFQWVAHPATAEIQALLARSAILVRAFETPASLRFGLPPDEAGWRRLEDALTALPATCMSRPCSSTNT